MMNQNYKEEPISVENIKKNSEFLCEKYSSKDCMVHKKTIFENINHFVKLIKDNGFKVAFKKMKLYKSGLYDNNPHFILDSTDVGAEIIDIFMGKKIAVYTAVFGGYDKINEPLYKNPNIDYFLFTDSLDLKSKYWNVRRLELKETKGMDAYHKSKFCKVFPEKILPGYDITMWIDGNIIIVGDVYPIILRCGNSSVAIFNNPVHDCITTEMKHMIYLGRVKEELITFQVSSYLNEGFPKHFGMRENSIIVRKSNDSFVRKIMDDWWIELNKFTMRDQISLPYVLWKNGVQIDYIKSLGVTWRWNPRFRGVEHLWEHKYQKRGNQ